MKKRQYIVNLGDVNWVTYGGFLITENDDGSYCAHVVYEPVDGIDEDDPDARWEVYSFDLDPIPDPALTNNREWWQDDLAAPAITSGMTERDLRDLLLSNDPISRGRGYQVMVGHWGAGEFDSYPARMTKEEVEEAFVPAPPKPAAVAEEILKEGV